MRRHLRLLVNVSLLLALLTLPSCGRGSPDPSGMGSSDIDPVGVFRRRGAQLEETSAPSKLTLGAAVTASAEYWDSYGATQTVLVAKKALFSSELNPRYRKRLVWAIGTGPFLEAAHAKVEPSLVQHAVLIDANTGALLDATSEAVASGGR